MIKKAFRCQNQPSPLSNLKPITTAQIDPLYETNENTAGIRGEYRYGLGCMSMIRSRERV